MLIFEQYGVEIHELNLFRGRNDKCYAQVIVDTKYSEKVESDNFGGLMEFSARTGRPVAKGKNAATGQTKTTCLIIMNIANNLKPSSSGGKLSSRTSTCIFLLMGFSILVWNVRGIMSSAICLSKLLEQTSCDVALVNEHKLLLHNSSFLKTLSNNYLSHTRCEPV